jgi:predicted transcriptional regulator
MLYVVHMDDLNNSSDEMVEALRDLGVPRNLATTIAYLKQVQEASSLDIEMHTGLRQPEVSVAMRSMRKYNWVEESNKKANGKGRPTKIYSLATPVETIISHYEQRVREENEARLSIIEKLKSLSRN